jgi:hypothetical protein
MPGLQLIIIHTSSHFISDQPDELGSVAIISMSKLRELKKTKLRLREIPSFTQGHSALEWKDKDMNLCSRGGTCQPHSIASALKWTDRRQEERS